MKIYGKNLKTISKLTERIQQYPFSILLGFVMLLALWPVFGHLGHLTIRMWDEGRLMANALEMYKNHNYLITMFDGEPDLWNTKPPLLIWLQVLSFHLFGISESSFRLPSALAGFLTILILFLFIYKNQKEKSLALLSAIILSSAQGYLIYHAVRSGDYDSLLTLFTTLAALLFYLYLEKEKPIYLYLFFISLTLAVLTKSLSGLFFTPAFFIFALYQKKIKTILSSRHFYIGFGSFVFLIGGYYWLREMAAPGYLEAVFGNELGRYGKVIETHHHSTWYFLQLMVDYKFTPWIFLVLPGFVFSFFDKNTARKKLIQYAFLLSLWFLILISSAKTKLGWYDVPLYPFLTLLAAYTLFIIPEWLSTKYRKIRAISIILILFILGFGYISTLRLTIFPVERGSYKDAYHVDYYLRSGLKKDLNLHNTLLVYDGYGTHHRLYLYLLQEKGINIQAEKRDNLKPGDLILTYEPGTYNRIQQVWNCEVIQNEAFIKKLKIIGPKSPLPN